MPPARSIRRWSRGAERAKMGMAALDSSFMIHGSKAIRMFRNKEKRRGTEHRRNPEPAMI